MTTARQSRFDSGPHLCQCSRRSRKEFSCPRLVTLFCWWWRCTPVSGWCWDSDPADGRSALAGTPGQGLRAMCPCFK